MTLAVDEPRIQEVVGSLSRKMLINGEWVGAAQGRTLESVNPATEDVLASVAQGEAEDADRRSAQHEPPSRTARRGGRCRTGNAGRSSTSSVT